MAEPSNPPARQPSDVSAEVNRIVAEAPVYDIHTHLYPPSFKSLFLSGIDDLLTYHYLVAELFRFSDFSPDAFWAMSKPQQADLIWETLFVRNTPLSEATRGVVCVMKTYGLDPCARSLKEAREFFSFLEPHDLLEKAMELAGVTDIVMTNDVFDEQETAYWESDSARSPRFHAAFRLDPLLNWDESHQVLTKRGYTATRELDNGSVRNIRKFLDAWIERMVPVYMAVSLPPTFRYPDDSVRGRLLQEAVLPSAREHKLPLSLMLGVRRRVNPALRGAGDGVGRGDVSSVERICLENSENRFLVSILSRENQHELCVAARKFANLMPFGCWWFLNNPSIVREITSERIEMLGTSFIPQHSDARVLDQIIYKWKHSREIIADSLKDAYRALARDGRHATPGQIERDVKQLFQGNFRTFAGITD